MRRSPISNVPGPAVLAMLGSLLALCILLLPACSSGGSQDAGEGPARGDEPLRGIFDDAWVKAPPAEQKAIVDEMAHGLHVEVVRLDLRWSLAEPGGPGQYDAAYLDAIEAAVDTARAAGLRVMIDVFGVPQWASDQSFWNMPPSGFQKGYQSFYPVAKDQLKRWKATAAYLAGRFKGKVAWWECWNEPNMWLYLFPQTVPGEPQFAAATYLALLKPFSEAVHGADPRAEVLGGVTAPYGMGTTMGTPPQDFLQDLKLLGAAKWWDGISHHPYTPAGVSPMPAPLAKPNFPDLTVSLGNIETLLRMFPEEPFYLTEYGYPTQESLAWGSAFVSEEKQAEYLTTAYRHVAGLEQVKMLTWFLWRDIDAGQDDPGNAFFGLKRPDGSRKPSWTAYARLR